MAKHWDSYLSHCNSPAGIKDFKKQVHEHYTITDIGPIHWILGIKVTHDRYAYTISLSQDSYANTILTRFNMVGANAVKCPMAPGSIFSCGTTTVKLTYGIEQHNLIGYTDTDGASQPHRHAISGYAFLLDGGAISWSSKKQSLVTASTTEVEYVAATHAAKEAFWLWKITAELFPSDHELITLYSDNKAAQSLAINENYHARTKHINIQYHFIREAIENGILKMVHCPTDTMAADMLTKAVPHWKMKVHTNILGLQA